MLVTKVQVTDLGGKSSANLTYFGCEKTLPWYSPSSVGDFFDESTSDRFRWQGSANLTYLGCEKTSLYIYLLLLDISVTKVQVTDLGGG